MRIHTTAATIICFLALIAPAGNADAPSRSQGEGQETNVSDVMNFLGIHSWKLRVAGPLRGVRVRVVQYVRGTNGSFQLKSVFTQFGFSYSPKMRSLPAAHVYAMIRADGKDDIFGVGIQEASSQNIRFPSSVLTGYEEIGDGRGGDGFKIGDEHILMTKPLNPGISAGRKRDMSAYIALVVSVDK